MGKSYSVNTRVRIVNRIMSTMIRLGIGPKSMYILTVRGRKTGTLYSTPISIVEQDGNRWLVSPYGEVSWVHNARAAGQVTLSRGRRVETVHIEELGPEESAPVLKAYITQEAITRPYFDAGVDSPLEAFAAEASRHPVFRILHGNDA